MGVQTVMLVASDFGSKDLKLDSSTLIITVVIIQLVALPGAIFLSKMSAKFGNLKVLFFTVAHVGLCLHIRLLYDDRNTFLYPCCSSWTW